MAKKPKDNELPVRLIKLRQGETVIARMQIADGYYHLHDPMLVMYIPYFDEEGNMSNTEIVFRDWIEGSLQSEFKIPADAVLLDAACDKSLLSTYQKIMKQDRSGDYFTTEYLDQASDMLRPKQPKKKKTKGPGLTGPPNETLGEDEDDLDTGDPPPRFRL